MRNNLAYSAYTQNSVSIESPIKLIEMLYEGILKFASRAKQAIIENKIENRVNFINKTIAIFIELTNSLDYSQGDVAHYLSGLYAREIQLLTLANLENKPEYVEEVINVTKELLEAWKEETADNVKTVDQKLKA